jgi:hypothetical protein
MTALVALGVGGFSTQLNCFQSQRMKTLAHQWSQPHSSDVQAAFVAERARNERYRFVGFGIGTFVLLNLVLAVRDRSSRKAEIPESASS